MMELQTIAFVSGKGGSGKSTVAICMSKLLSDMGIPVLLVDFDLATNGSSYFFRDRYTRRSLALWDILVSEKRPFDISELPIQVSENFWFVPSRVVLNRKGESYDSVLYKKEYLKESILSPLVAWAREHGVFYTIIDCQAGFAISSAAAAEMSDRAILVSEADAVSSDAADNLLIQMGTSLPENRRYLVNKIDIRDAEAYRNMSNVFQSLNRLPPLPFDFSVRAAFGARRIPIDVQKPSPLLFALFETVKAAFPELFSVVEEYSKKNLNELFQDYDHQMQSLAEKKRRLEEEQIDLKTFSLRRRYKLTQNIIPFLSLLLLLLAFPIIAPSIWERLSFYLRTVLQGTVITVVGASTFALYRIVTREQVRSIENELHSQKVSNELREVNEELDRYRSLLWTTSKSYLVDHEIARGSKGPSQTPAGS